ncbi:Uncharacterised protein [[Clostridium] sordellii]|uniref:hypothetical protein n=1 Tax=Paraclostridium sordellii TaxID=1505 RepID=UPI0005E164C6|nr:hypothetical protein [Paeniclostridium sordellii]QYE98953.1 hypothetical protein KZ987_05390 [Paeniclostridium sordellii]CEQ22359.1 Uncharacterised protein [[Clostridium] sordellii] [Paeniclostridium sordellii]
MKNSKYLNSLKNGLEIICTIVLVRIVGYFTGFKYSLFEDGLSFKLIIDFSMWIVLYILVSTFIDKIYNLLDR